jgi:hypothetical protein
MHIYLMKEHVLHNYLQEWISSMASKYLWVNDSARRLDQLIPKLTNSIQNLMEVSMHCLNGPPKRPVDNSKSLVVTNHMEEHCNLLLYCDPLSIRN